MSRVATERIVFDGRPDSFWIGLRREFHLSEANNGATECPVRMAIPVKRE